MSNITKYLFGFLATVILFQPVFSQKKKAKEPAEEPLLSETFHGLQWRNLGPYRGGRTNAVAGVADDILTYYMGATGGGVWKTTDGGISWKNISDNYFNVGTIGAIAVAPSDKNVVYVGTGEHAVRGVMTSVGDGVYKSTDAGKTWQNVGLPKSQTISDIVIHPANPDIVYVAVQGAAFAATEERGVYQSLNGGKTWNKIFFTDKQSGAVDLKMDPSNPRILYVAMWDMLRKPWEVRSGGEGSGIYKSTDSGETWNELTEGLPDVMGKIGISVSPANPDRIYAVIEAEGESGGVYRSDNGGNSWQQTNKDRINIARAWYYIEIEADPQNPDKVYVLNSPITKSIDGGKTFAPIPVPHVDTHDHWINPNNPDIMINANDGGATITYNGGQTWSTQENQPTAQFYRVTADKQFPYFLYSGQQDNNAVAMPSMSFTGPGISWKDWFDVAGGESAYLAFDDPENPEVTYGSSIEGFINSYNLKTDEYKSLDVYPELLLGKTPKDMKYRFNWNPPLMNSLHAKGVMYYGAQKLLKSSDGGINWSEISPDLTRNNKDQQGAGGLPFTNEAAGGENYNTIMYFKESPHKAGVIYVGSDDGLVHVTQNDGQSWSNVSPKALQESIINAIEVSPHDPATAYVVAMRYKFNDFQPYIYKTTDFGATWTKITSGIDPGHFVRVVREDKKVKNLLYAGTERGIYLSYDGGASWKPFQLNFPPVPITDLAIVENDLAASTAGRGFWILDDLNAIQQKAYQGSVKLVEPENAVSVMIGSPPVPIPNLGQNPPSGAILDYYLPEDSIDVTLKIFDADKSLVRTLTSIPDDKEPNKPLISAKKGLNRTIWDLHMEVIEPIKNTIVYGSYFGHLVMPGEYFVSLVTETDSLTVPLKVVADPRMDFSDAEYEALKEMMAEIDETIAEISESIADMRDAKAQISDWNTHLSELEEFDTLKSYGTMVMDSLTNWENQLVQPKMKTFQDVVNYNSMLTADFMYLKGYIESQNPKLTGGAKLGLEDLNKKWDKEKARLDYILNELLPGYNALFKAYEVPALILDK